MLLEAARAGDAARVRELVQGGALVDAKGTYGETALMYASQDGYMDVVRFLVDRGADETAVDTNGNTVLMYASEGGHMDIVQLLVDRGADVNALENNGETALMRASTFDYMDVVRFLVNRGADVNAFDNDGRTALMHSLWGIDDKDVVQLLVDQGAEVNTVDNDGLTPLMYGSRRGNMDVVQLLVDQGAEVNTVDNNGWTALMAASENGHINVVRFFLDRGTDVNAVDNDGWTALMAASENGHINVVRFLVDRGADVNAVDTNGKTAVYFAASQGHAAVSRFLASHLHVVPSAIHSRLDALHDPKSQSSTRWLIAPFEVALQMQIDREDVGVQFRAKWLDADVVIKLFIPGASMASFADEVAVWQQLRHPNVIKLYGACNVGHYFFVSEFASNGCLVDHLAVCRRTGRKCTPWKFLHEAALGLAYFHERNIVHGDLRGSNILIGNDGLAKLSEFSLSGLIGGSAPSEVFGPKRWQSPERVNGGDASFSSDVYSLGLCIVEALSGKIPWAIEYDFDVISSQIFWDPATNPRSMFAPGPLTDNVVDLVSHMCALDPKKRVAASVAAQMLERLATQERSERQVKQQPEPEPNLSINKYDKYMNGELTRLWTKIQAAVPTYAGSDLHRPIFDEVQAMYEELGESTRQWKLLEQFRKLLVDIEAMMRPGSFQNRIQRLSATRATGFAMIGLRRRLDGIWSVMKGSPPELETYKQRWREQQADHPELFISEEEQTLLVLKELNTEEDWMILLKILRSEIDDHRDDYTKGQLSVIQKAYDNLVEHNKSDIVMTTPEWFLPLHELEVDEASCVGAGGFGGVYRARWLESEMVIKLLDQGDSAGQSNDDSAFTSYSSSSVSNRATVTPVDREKKKEQRRMFEREVSFWFGLSHPHIVRLFGACHIGTLFFACEYASKGSLDKYLRKHPDKLWQKLYEAALGVQYLHARSVVHGDLKCNNILVGGDGKAKVTDFGLSSDTAQLEKAQVSGASHWVAPECLEHGASKLSAASDVYSLGMCVVEALRVVELNTLKHDSPIQYPLPWGDLPNPAVKYHVVQAKKLPPRPQICSDDEWRLVTRMCRNDPSDRLKISTVVDEFGLLASAKASVGTESRTPSYEQATMPAPMLETTSQTKFSTRDLANCLRDITPSPAAAVVDSAAAQLEPIQAVIAQMQTCTRLTEDGNRKVLNQIFGLLWDRMAHLSSVISDDGGDLESLRELVERAEESTKALPEVQDTLIEFTQTAMRGYALHRNLDKLIDAKFWLVDTEGSEVHEWKLRCNEFLDIADGSANPSVSSEVRCQDVQPDHTTMTAVAPVEGEEFAAGAQEGAGSDGNVGR